MSQPAAPWTTERLVALFEAMDHQDMFKQKSWMNKLTWRPILKELKDSGLWNNSAVPTSAQCYTKALRVATEDEGRRSRSGPDAALLDPLIKRYLELKAEAGPHKGSGRPSRPAVAHPTQSTSVETDLVYQKADAEYAPVARTRKRLRVASPLPSPKRTRTESPEAGSATRRTFHTRPSASNLSNVFQPDAAETQAPPVGAAPGRSQAEEDVLESALRTTLESMFGFAASETSEEFRLQRQEVSNERMRLDNERLEHQIEREELEAEEQRRSDSKRRFEQLLVCLVGDGAS